MAAQALGCNDMVVCRTHELLSTEQMTESSTAQDPLDYLHYSPLSALRTVVASSVSTSLLSGVVISYLPASQK